MSDRFSAYCNNGMDDARAMWQQVLIPLWEHVTERSTHFKTTLYIPDAAEYARIWADVAADFCRLFSSLLRLLWVTGRPIALFLYYASRAAAIFTWKRVLQEGGVCKRGLICLKEWIIAAWKLQCSLTKEQVAVEAGAIALIFVLYQLRKFLQRQRYYQRAVQWYDERKRRAMRWYRRKRREAVQLYRGFFRRVGEVSVVAAIMAPHALCVGILVGMKMAFPSLFAWLATETSLVWFASWVYPLAATIFVLHESALQREEEDQEERKRKLAQEQDDAINRSDDDENDENADPGWEEERASTTSKKRSSSGGGRKSRIAAPARRSDGFFRRTHPATASAARSSSLTGRGGTRPRSRTTGHGRLALSSPLQRMMRRTAAAAVAGHSPEQQQQNPQNGKDEAAAASAPHSTGPTLEEQETYWLQYWIVYASLQAVKRCAWLLPVVGSLVAMTGFNFVAFVQQLELAWYAWLYVVPHIMPERLGEQVLPEYRNPLPAVLTCLEPTLSAVHGTLSNAVSEERWDRYVVSKLSPVLDILVMIKVTVSRPTADWILHCVAVGRTLLIPAVTLFMPWFVTAYGVAYVQFVLPAATMAAGAAGVAADDEGEEEERRQYHRKETQESLQYWVLHGIATALLSMVHPYIFWMPFLTHATFVLWCYMSLPATVRSYFPVVRKELQIFGLLDRRCPEENDDDASGDQNDSLENSKSLRAIRWILKRMPSAAANDGDDENENGRVDGGRVDEDQQEAAAGGSGAEGDGSVRLDPVVEGEGERLLEGGTSTATDTDADAPGGRELAQHQPAADAKRAAEGREPNNTNRPGLAEGEQQEPNENGEEEVEIVEQRRPEVVIGAAGAGAAAAVDLTTEMDIDNNDDGDPAGDSRAGDCWEPLDTRGADNSNTRVPLDRAGEGEADDGEDTAVHHSPVSQADGDGEVAAAPPAGVSQVVEETAARASDEDCTVPACASELDDGVVVDDDDGDGVVVLSDDDDDDDDDRSTNEDATNNNNESLDVDSVRVQEDSYNEPAETLELRRSSRRGRNSNPVYK